MGRVCMAPVSPAIRLDTAAGDKEAAIPGEDPDPQAGPGEPDEDGHLMMAGEEGDAEEHAGERGVGERSNSAGDAELEEKDERGPDGAVHHDGPGGVAQEAGEGE